MSGRNHVYNVQLAPPSVLGACGPSGIWCIYTDAGCYYDEAITPL